MKTIYSISFAICLLLCTNCAAQNQGKFGNFLNKAKAALSSPTADEMGFGLKEALEVGVSAGTGRLSAENGFFNNTTVKILFPPEAQKVEKTIRNLGLNSLADQVILSLNKAAEDAAKEAKPIFVSAIKQMTIADASKILLGKEQDGATQYFKRVSSDELRLKFQPIIQASLAKVGATQYWGDVMTRYNKLPLVTQINPDLEGYVTQKAIDGLFHEVALEELKIRQNAGARGSALLQKVFGYADTKR